MAVGPAENNGYTGEQLFIMVEQKPECRRAGRNNQLRLLVAILMAIDIQQIDDIVRIPEAGQIGCLDIDRNLTICFRTEAAHDPVIPVRVHRQVVSERVHHEHAAGFSRCRCGKRRRAHQHQHESRKHSAGAMPDARMIFPDLYQHP